jgi:hypothetical protein
MDPTLAMTTAEQGMVLIAVAALAAPLAALMFARSGPAWRSIGKGPLAIEPEERRRGDADPVAERAEQAAEVRQMLAAKAERRRRRGEPPLDVEAEARRLLGGAGADSGAPIS